MPDILTPHERAAIAAFKGNVQRIPLGHASETSDRMAVGMPWKERHKIKVKIHLRSGRFNALKRREIEAENPPKPPKLQDVVIAERRAEVRRLTLEGLRQTEIAEKLGATASVISWDVSVMRANGGFPSAQECRAIRRRRGLE